MRWVAAALLCVGAVLWFSPVHADKRTDAKALFEEGQRKFDVGKFDDAAANWVQAYELVGNPILLYNIAQAYRLGNHYEKALSFYKAYLRRDEKTAVKAEVEARMAEMTRLMDQSRKSNEAPPQGTIEVHEAKPENGKPPVVETKPEAKPEAKPEQPTEQKPAEQTPTPPAAQAQPDPQAKFRYAGYGLIGLAVASVAVGGAMTGLSKAAASDVEKAAKNGGTFDSSLQSKANSAPTYDAVAVTFYALAGASAVGAGVLLYMGFRKQEAPRASLTPMFSNNAAGILVQGRF